MSCTEKNALSGIEITALIMLKRNRKHLSRQQYKTLRGQVLSGNVEGALKGLRTIFDRREPS